MVRLCCIPICPNSKADRGVACFAFPPDADRRNQWIDFVGGDPSRFRWKTKYICADHFLQQELLDINGKLELMEGAVPMVYSPEDDEDDELMDRNDVMVSEDSMASSSSKGKRGTETVVQMKVETEQLLSMFCRICLRKAPGLIPLNSKLKLHSSNLVDMIYLISGLRVDTVEGLPMKICADCVEKVDLAFNIRMEFVKHDETLRNLVDTNQLQQYFKCYGSHLQKKPGSKNEVYLNSLIKTVKQDSITGRPIVFLDSNVKVIPIPSSKSVRQSVRLTMKTSQPEVWSGTESEMSGTAANKHPSDDDGSALALVQTVLSETNDNVDVVSNDTSEEKPKKVFLRKQHRQKEPVPATKKLTEFKIKDQQLPRPKLVPNTCYICDTANEDAQSLEAHMEKHVDVLPYKCEQCSTEEVPHISKSLIALNKHLQTHLYPYRCDYCPLRFLTYGSYVRHMREIHLASEFEGFTCDYCGKFFARKRLFDMHRQKHKAMEEETYKCEHCGKVFGCGDLLRRHVRIHTGETPYACTKCGKRFNHFDNFKNHKRSHIGEKGHSCEECGQTFTNSTCLRQHMAKHFPEDPRYKCRIQKSGAAKDKEYACNYENCTFVTTKYQTFFVHRANHEKKFQCEICAKRFPLKSLLVKHIAVVHEGKVPELNLKCPYCTKCFAKKEHLKIHVAAHEGNRRYKCQYCPKAFVQVQNCRAHERIHTGERPYVCRMCPAAFISSSGKKKHEQQVHPDLMYESQRAAKSLDDDSRDDVASEDVEMDASDE